MACRALFLLVSAMLFSASSAVAAAPPPETGQDEYDFSWLDPEKKIYVVQNRKYTKKNRIELALSAGFGMGEAYRNTRIVLPRAFFYLNENWGVSAFGGWNSNEENDDAVGLKSTFGVIPAVREVKSFMAGSVVWVPFYGKVNMFNQIFYIDWHLEAGVGQLTSEIDLNTRSTSTPRLESNTFTSMHWGTGQKFFITRSLAARLDFLALYYKAPNGLSTSTTATSAAGTVEQTYDSYYVTLGLSWTF